MISESSCTDYDLRHHFLQCYLWAYKKSVQFVHVNEAYKLPIACLFYTCFTINQFAKQS
jgi:hypothetical protein